MLGGLGLVKTMPRRLLVFAPLWSSLFAVFDAAAICIFRFVVAGYLHALPGKGQPNCLFICVYMYVYIYTYMYGDTK